MGYRIRVLGQRLTVPPLAALRSLIAPALIDCDQDEASWASFVLKHSDGTEICLVERDLVTPGELGGDEIDEFIEEAGHYQPAQAAAWLRDYLPTVKVIYSFQFLSGTEKDDGFQLLQGTQGYVWSVAGGILQADGEGFSNEQGSTILWQFEDYVSGPWKMGSLVDGAWVNYEMDLGNKAQRGSFLLGEVPAGVVLHPA